MNRLVTPLLPLAAWCLLAAWAAPAQAQFDRNGVDILWARDVEGATLTLDGNLNEAAWAEAERTRLRWEDPTFNEPGGGWDDFFASFPEENNTDPVDATVLFLRDGNTLWIGVNATDASIGGSVLAHGEFFQHDGVVMSITDKRNRPDAYAGPHWFNGGNTDEFFYSWLSNDTTATGDPRPGAMPFHFGTHGDDRDLWEGATVVTGTTNDDSGGDDTGYTMEIRIDVSTLGFDFDDGPGGDRLPMTIAVYDKDYAWPPDVDRQFLSRAWFQNAWGGDMPYGVAFIYGRPDVTISSGGLPTQDEPELRLGTTTETITVDGALDEDVWGEFGPQVELQYQATIDELDELPGFGPLYTHWFRPGGDDPSAPPVVDPSTGRFRFFFKGNTLYIGLDSDDQAISGNSIEDRGDGMRFTIRSRESEDGDPYAFNGFLALIDSTGTLDVITEPDSIADPQVALALKGSSTIANPDDIDEGYQIEMAIDLTTIPGYEGGLGDRIIWIGATYFDGDYLPDPADYGTRTWWLVERGGGPFGGPAARTYLDPQSGVASEGGPGELPSAIRLVGSYPNPFGASTELRYILPEPGRVTVLVYDVMGRAVAHLVPGLQAAGANRVTLDAAGLASGVYVYRVRLEGAHGVEVSAGGQVTLLK